MPEPQNTVLFSEIPLSTQLARAVGDLAYTNATSIQSQAIPVLLEGRDVIGHSCTGSGKTAAFGIPAVEMVDGTLKKPQVLVLSPTRELAMQIAREMQKYAKYKEGIRVACVYGGASMPDQIRQLRYSNVVIGTPGRLMDHLCRRTLKMDGIKMVVLDEADEMLSMGFIEDIQEILSHAPEQRQTVLFSATMPPPVLKISKEFLSEPQVVDVLGETASDANIEQTFYYVPHNQKQDALTLLLRANDAQHSIIFCNTKAMVDELAEKLTAQGFRAGGLHGDMTQAVRTQVMARFRSGSIQILVATDVAARGIDVSDIDAVINYDLPQSFEYYVHRIGRTGRAGKAGVSQTLVSNPKQLSLLKSLMRFTGNEIKEHKLPTGAELQSANVEKLAAKLIKEQATPSKAANHLTQLLLDAYSPEEATLLLASALLAGNASFAEIADVPQRKERAKPERTKYIKVTANIGQDNRINPNHIIGTLVECLDIQSKDIGKIEIKPNCSHIQLSEGAAKALFAYKHSIRIMGVKVKFAFPKARAHKPRQQNR